VRFRRLRTRTHLLRRQAGSGKDTEHRWHRCSRSPTPQSFRDRHIPRHDSCDPARCACKHGRSQGTPLVAPRRPATVATHGNSPTAPSPVPDRLVSSSCAATLQSTKLAVRQLGEGTVAEMCRCYAHRDQWAVAGNVCRRHGARWEGSARVMQSPQVQPSVPAVTAHVRGCAGVIDADNAASRLRSRPECATASGKAVIDSCVVCSPAGQLALCRNIPKHRTPIDGTARRCERTATRPAWPARSKLAHPRTSSACSEPTSVTAAMP